MNLKLIRDQPGPDVTLGKLYVDGVFACYTCEDAEREEKIHGKTAIPRGTYRVIINQSNRFKRLLPLILKVPNFEGIRIHPGNTAADTEGCILPGLQRTASAVTQSRLAFNELFEDIAGALDVGETVEIEITGAE